MKKFLAALSVLAAGLWFAHGVPFEDYGPATLKFDAITQAVNFHQTGGKTNQTTTSTNITMVFAATIATSNFTSADLLVLLANSFNTNFPAGSQIGMVGGTLLVVDSTGTNLVFNPGAVLTTTFEENFQSTTETEIETDNKSGFSLSGNDTETQTASMIITYNDNTQTTADSTHTNFALKGLFVSKISSNLKTRTRKVSSTFHGTGGGPVRNVQTILTGTITLKVTGPLLLAQNYFDTSSDCKA